MNYIVDECFRAEVDKYSWCLNKRNRRWMRRGHFFDEQGRSVGKRTEMLHRFIWRLSGRELPEGRSVTIDHINRDSNDNRLENLRLATRSMQNLNRAMQRKDGLPRGVRVNQAASGRSYSAVTRMGGEGRTIGCYATPEEASAAYEAELARQIEIEETRVKELMV